MAKIIYARTHHECLNRVIDLAWQNEGLFEKQVIIVPDRYTFEVEQKLLKNRAGTFSIEVQTLRRLALSYAPHDKKLLTRQGAAARMSLIIRENASELACFERAVGKKGFASTILDTINQFKSSGILPHNIKLTGEDSAGRKLEDIKFLYSEYERFLESDSLCDAGDLLFNLKEYFSRADLKNTAYYIANFTSFTKQVADILIKLNERSAQLFVATVQNPVNTGLNNEEHLKKLGEMFPSCEREYACESLPLHPLLDKLYRPQVEGFSTLKPTKVFEAKNLIGELLFVARDIKQRVICQGIRYRDIGIVINQPCHDIVERVFASLNIPYYFEKKLILREHSYCRLILDILEAQGTGLRQELVLRVLKNSFAGIEKDEADIFENYVLERAIDYDAFLEDFDCEISQKVRLALMDLFSIITAKLKNASDYEAALSSLVGKFKAQNCPDPFMAQVERAFKSVICQLIDVCGDFSISAAEYSDMLENALKNLSISIIPEGSDCVAMGEAQMFLSLGKKVLYCVGMNEGILPPVKADLGIFSDSELSALKRVSNIDVQPHIRAINRDERDVLLQAIASSCEVCFSFSQASLRAEALKPSFFLSSITKLIANAQGICQNEQDEMILKADCEQIENNPYEYIAYLGGEKGALHFLRASIGAYNERRLTTFPYLARFLVEKFKHKLIVEQQAHNVLQNARLIRSSCAATQLETYFSCPYKHFLSYGLKCVQRREGKIEGNDTGNFLHKLLEHWTRQGSNPLKMAELFDSIIVEFPILNHKNNSYWAQRLKQEAIAVGFELAREAASTEFKTVAAEVRFGAGARFKPIEIKTKYGSFDLSGKIDRVDKAGDYVRVVDYKTGKNVSLTAKQAYMGEKLQLFLYLYALTRDKYKPAGAFYFKVHNNPLAGKNAFRFVGSFVYNDEVVNLLDNGLQDGQKSLNVCAAKNKDGRLSASRNALCVPSVQQMNELCERAVAQCAKAVEEIYEGYIEPKPCEGACNICNGGSICFFNESGLKERS